VQRAGAIELRLSYLVPNASWRPIWDARLDPERREVELSFHGSVQQTTGEDWSDVTLALSTAQPGRGLYVPELFPQFLDKAQRPAPVRQRSRGAPGAPAAAPSMAEEPFAKSMDMAEELDVEPLQHPEATFTQGLLSATFTAPRRESVDGAGRARKVMLSRIPLEAELMRVSAPRQDPQAYLTAKASNATGAPLLAGEASVFVGDEFVGRAQLPLTPPGGELQLAFGADDRVKIERRMVERKHETAGIVSKDDVYRYRTLTKVKNLYATPVKVRVLDLVPVSRDEIIEVKLLEGTTAPTGPGDAARPGVRTHEVELKPGEERSIDLRYEVRFPRGQAIAGLE
jgi:uncharacterized protein (TIGR02231 family)